MATKPLTDEELRILCAVDDGRLEMNRAGRYEIDGEERPGRRSRENLRKKNLIEPRLMPTGAWGYTTTHEGKARIRTELAARRAVT